MPADETHLLDNYRELASEILAQAVDDYRYLRRLTVIRPDHSVNSKFWSRRPDGSWNRPINIESPQAVEELIWFFNSPQLDILARFVGIPACQIRTRLGFKSRKFKRSIK